MAPCQGRLRTGADVNQLLHSAPETKRDASALSYVRGILAGGPPRALSAAAGRVRSSCIPELVKPI